MLGVASGPCGRGDSGSLDGSGVETDAEEGQVMPAVVAAGAGRGLVWVSLGRWRASAGTESGGVGATAAGKKFSRLSLGCFGVVGVSPAACEDKGEVRKASLAALSPYGPTGYLSGPRSTSAALTHSTTLWAPRAANEGHGRPFGTPLMPGTLPGTQTPPWEDVRAVLLGTWRRDLRLATTSSQLHPFTPGCQLGRSMSAMTQGMKS